MATITNRYRQLYTHGGKLFNIDEIDTKLGPLDLEMKYGWEAIMAYYNLIHDDLNTAGRGVRSGDIVVDLGANIGMSALNMEQKNPAKIYCVEPDVRSYETLLLNKNDNWVVDNFAIGSGECTFNVAKWPSQISVPVRSITLDQYFAQHNFSMVNFMKIDIEGHEKQLFQNVSQDTMNKIESMAIEYHEDETLSFEQKNDDRWRFVNSIASRGFFNFTVFARKWQSMIYFWK